jgi:hypothetical protein
MKTHKIELVVLISITLFFNSCSITKPNKIENSLNTINNFSDKIINEGGYGMFWQGYVNYAGDTLFFQFVGNVRYRVNEENNEDILYFKAKDSFPLIITREVKDMLNRPVVDEKKGKEMTAWSFLGFKKDNLLKIEEVLKNGEIYYYHVPTDRSKAIKKMQYLYGIEREKAEKILRNMEKP